MSEETQKSAPGWFKVVAIIAILWNLMGVLAYLMQVMMTPEMLAMMPEKERMMYENVPMLAMVGYALAVWGGLAGSITLLMKKAISHMLLAVSLAGILLQQITNYFFTDLMSILGAVQIIMSLLVIVIAIFLLRLAGQGKAEGWIK